MSEKIQYKFIPIENLEFDSRNPRLPKRLRRQNGTEVSEREILEWMLGDGGAILELMVSIGEHGYFGGEPLLVTGKCGCADKWTVVEGNRRLAAVKLLLNPELAPKRKHASVKRVSEEAHRRPQEIPSMIYDTRGEILTYLGYRHVTGIKKWSTLSKARYLDQLLPSTRPGTLDEKFKELARAIGSRKDYVARLLAGLALYNKIEDKKFYQIEGLNEETLGFTLLTTAVSYANICQFLGLEDARDPSLIGLEEDRLEELARLVYEKKEGRTAVGESRNLKHLNKFILHPFALQKFKEGTPIEEAAEIADVADQGGEATLFRQAVHNAEAKLDAADGLIEGVESLFPADADTLNRIQAKAHTLFAKAEARILRNQASLE